MFTCPIQQKRRPVHPGNLKSSLCELHGMSSRSAAEIKQDASTALSQVHDAADLVLGGSKPLRRKHEGIKILPKFFALKPFHRAECITGTSTQHSAKGNCHKCDNYHKFGEKQISLLISPISGISVKVLIFKLEIRN